MANIETLDLSEQTLKAEGVSSPLAGPTGQGLLAGTHDDTVQLSKTDAESADSAPVPSPGSSSGPHRSTGTNGVAPGVNNVPTLVMPHPKKFSHVNINKKFLEKTSSSAGTSIASTSSSKPGSVIPKPALQSTPSHSRLVTAKLTAGPQPSTLTGPGWSRPSSTGSSATPTPSSIQPPKPSPLPSSSQGPPQLPPVGKVIQPQLRPAELATNGGKKDATSRPAWGQPRLSPASTNKSDGLPGDFPTAAEVAQAGRSAKSAEKKHNETMAAEADAFRGVHLNPNVHHWDEDEEENDDFLGEVIEFGDGRQYTIPTDQPTLPQEGPPQPADSTSSTELVSKEDRFGDDIGRSWPRSRDSRPPTTHQRDHGHFSASSSRPPHPSQESSRVLFNERSNRLEPYSSTHYSRYNGSRDGYGGRRDNRSDNIGSPTETRDTGFHSQRPHVQLLQKSPTGEFGNDAFPPPKSSGDRPSTSYHHDPSRNRDREPFRREFSNNHAPRSSSRQGDHHSQWEHHPFQDRPHHDFPPPHSPNSLEIHRQLPPHLSKLQTTSPRISNDVTLSPERLTSSQASSSPLPAAHSPVVSNASLSPLITERSYQGPSDGITDLKATMHSAAERARLRRQQDEEEREREKERARRKAAEIEAKIKMKEAEKKAEAQSDGTEGQKDMESNALQFLEDVVRSVNRPPNGHSLESIPEDSSSRSSIPQSLPEAPQSAHPRRTTFPIRATDNARSPPSEVESWRKRTETPNHQKPILGQPNQHPLLNVSVIDNLDIKDTDDIEVVDFSDHGKLVGSSPSIDQGVEKAQSHHPSRYPPRPVATDFFDKSLDHEQSEQPLKAEEGSWRRRKSLLTPESIDTAHANEYKQRPALTPRQTVTSQRRLSSASDDYSRTSLPTGGNVIAAPTHPPKSPLTPSYREAPMSALNDAMARIKGALDGMQKPEPSKPQRWIPPALRIQDPSSHDEVSVEAFDISIREPPRSPKPAWNHFTVRLPSVSISRPSAPIRRQTFGSKTQVRSVIYSWDPPLEGIYKRDFNLNDALFGGPTVDKNTPKYIVSISPHGRAKGENDVPVVNLPSKQQNNVSRVFGRRREADGVLSWRKPPPSPLTTAPPESADTEELNTVSRSPPPDAPSSSKSAPSPQDEQPSLTVSMTSAKPRTQQSRLPTDSDVAFYRDGRGDIAPTTRNVNFIVNSELDEDTPAERKSVKEHTSGPVLNINGSTGDSKVVSSRNISSRDEKFEAHKTDTPSMVKPISPPHLSSGLPWSPGTSRVLSLKESPSRTLDRDDLKAVWEQNPGKARQPSVNSLKNIGDDPAAVPPFTLLDVKSEDGETPPPPPSSNPPSRMSLHDVTRAFQMVPSGPSSMSSASMRSVPLPSTSSGSQRQASNSMPPPSQLPPSRPAYAGYAPPLVGSPSPTMMYSMPMTPSPIPRPMVVSSVSQYPQPMWVPVPPSSSNGGMMRSVPPSYGGQLMPYPPPMPIYLPQGMPGSIPTPNGMGGRPPSNVQMMSPVLPPAQANHQYYPSSPMLMPSPPIMNAIPGYPSQNPAARGRGMYNNTIPNGPHPNVPPYTSITSNAFDRPTW
ncbi:hypothetical protein ABKN59_001033 [Abortiporus biennis]